MPDAAPSSFYDLECLDVRGNPFSLRQFAGKPVLIVNTASLCGFSSQFKGLETMWQRYKDQGLMVLGVPSNDFGHQEPGNSADIVKLCSSKFGITFPLTAKTQVKGDGANQLFRWIADEAGYVARPRWNFYKYIIGRDGQLHDWFSPWTSPDTPRFNKALSKVVVAA